MTETEKLIEIYKLQPGDKIKLTTGQEAEFVRLKKTRFVGLILGVSYDIPITMFDRVLEKAAPAPESPKVTGVDIAPKLKPGDWFYINNRNRAEVYIFKEIHGTKIIGLVPFDNQAVRIDMGFEMGIVPTGS